MPGTAGNFRSSRTFSVVSDSQVDQSVSHYTEEDGINGDLSKQLQRREKKQRHIKTNKKNGLD